MNAHRPWTTLSKLSLGASVVGLLALPSLALAQADKGSARYKKQEIEVEGVKQTELTKPTAPPKDKKSSGPVLTIDEFIGERQSKIQQITDRQVSQMQRLIRVTDDSDPQKPDFHFRLAELFAEKQRFHQFQARSLDQKIFDAAPGAKTAMQREQQQHEADSQKWLFKAVEHYVEASKFKKFDRMDEVLFRLAYLLQMAKKEDQAREFFHRLIKDYPQSKYVPYAFLSFAEYFFGNGDMNSALKFYEQVEKFPKSSVYGYAIYKKGWCQINLGDFRKALEIFVDVIKLGKSGKIDKVQAGPLIREARKDVVKAYARTPGASPDKAWDFFRNVGEDMAPKMMEALGELYWEQGQFVDSTKTYRKIISLNLDSPRICEWQNKIVRNTLSAGNKRDQVQEIERLGAVYEKTKGMQAKKDVMQECKNSFHDTAKELALIWHKEAQRTKNPDTYHLTKLLYKQYMDHFAAEKGSVDMAFYFAEVLWVTESWREAAEQYTKVVQMDPKGKYVKEAAYAAVLAWKNALNIDDSGEGPDKEKQSGKDMKPRKIPEYQQKMIAAFDTYLKYVPDSDMVVKIKYRKARIYYDYNHFEDAVKYYKDIVENHSKDELAIYSANLLLDSLNVMGRTKELIAYVDKFLGMPDLMKDPEFQKQMVMIKTDSYVAEGKKFEQQGNFKECGISMLAAAESLPEHPKHAERLYDAGVCFTNGRLIGQAIRVREELIKQYPKDPLAQKALYQIAAGYHQIASYTEAARRYEEFATKFPGEKMAATALGNAYQFRKGLNDYEKAREDMDNYVKYYGTKNPKDAAAVFFQLAEIYEKQNRMDELAKHLDAYVKKWGAQGGADRQIFAHFRMGEIAWKKSCPKEGVNGACINVERVSASGKQKAIYDINKKIKDRKKKLKVIRTQCGPPTHAKISVLDRNKAMAAQAQTHFQTALKLWGSNQGKIAAANPAEAQERMAMAAYGAGGALFYQAEQTYEDFLRVKFPEGLDFSPPGKWDSPRKAKEKQKKSEDSIKRFKAYLEQKGKVTEKLASPQGDKKGTYLKVMDFKVAHWTIAAAARVGQIWANFADQLYTAEIPKHLKDMDEWGVNQKDIYCDTLVDQAEPLEKKAIEGYDTCLKAATAQSWFNEWSNLCEGELNQMQPTEYPLAAEVKPEPGYVSILMTPASVVQDLPAESVQVVGKENN